MKSFKLYSTMLGWEKVELVPGVKIVGAATLNDLVLESDKAMWF